MTVRDEGCETRNEKRETRNETRDRPIVAITLGDVAGIGPEITAKVLAEETARSACRPIVIGDAPTFARTIEALGLPLRLHLIDSPKEAAYWDEIDFLHVEGVPSSGLPHGQVHPLAGEAAVRFTRRAVALALEGQVDAICSAPVNKEAMRAAGYGYEGQTQLIAEECGRSSATMMLQVEDLRVFLLTTHMALREACDAVTRERVLTVLRQADGGLKELGFSSPVLAVAGLNPHAGEGGLFGREEIDEIAPAIEAARAEGIDARGPIPPDTVFVRARGGEFDAVVALYHDQANIPLKLIGFGEVVTVLVGLPIIRTSVGHGTAFDIAGKGIAGHENLLSALRVAAELALRRRS